MKGKDKTTERSSVELAEMRQRIAELEGAEAELRQAEKALKQHAARLALLNDIGGKIAVMLDLDSVLEKAVSLVHEGFGYHRVGLFILDRERGELVMRARAGDFANLLPPDHHRLKLKRGIVGRAGYYGKSLLANDVDAEPRYVNPYPDVIPPRSELSVPIGMGGEVVGVLDIQSPQRNAFDEGDVLTMEALADQIAAAMKNARLYDAAQQELAERKRLEESLREARDELEDRVEERTAELLEANERLKEEFARRERTETIWRGLQQLGVKLARLRDDEMIFDATTQELNSLGLFSILFKLDDSGQKLRIASVWSAVWRAMQSIMGLCMEDISLPLEQVPTFAEVLDRGEPLYLTDVLQRMKEQGRFIPGWDKFLPYLTKKLRLPARGVLAPLVVGGEPVGLLAISSDELSEAYVPIIGAFARTMSAAVENARLYQQAQQEIAERVQLEEQLSAIYQLGQELALLREEDVILRRVLETANVVLRFDLVGYGLVNEAAGELVYCCYMAGGALKVVDLHLPLDGERGIGTAVVRDGHLFNMPDASQDARYVSITGDQIRSELCVPMKIGERVLGVLNAESVELNHFTPADQQLLQILANQAAVALENARLYADIRTRADELSMLNEIGLVLTATLDPATVLHTALSLLKPLFEAEDVSLLQPDHQAGDSHFVRISVRAGPGDASAHLPVKGSVAEWALEQGQPVLIEDVQSDSRFPNWVDHTGVPTRALMAAPLLTYDRAIGVIHVASGEPGAYTHEQLQMLGAIASTLTVALENARLYEELKTTLREREETQAQLIHAEKMGALGRLVASIAHEINNPLQSVQGCLTLAVEELDGSQRREKLDRYLGVAGSEVERISTIVQRLRDLYRPVREGKRPTDLHALLESLLVLTDKQLQYSNVAVERAWCGELPVIQANADQLRQVFLNLVLNAIDAMPEGGPLRISTNLDEVEIHGGQAAVPAVRVEFSDAGKGVPEDMLPHMFEPFFTTKENGSGLGLSTSYGIIESHNGQIAVTSEAGVGTTFTILLPVEQP
ncbi:MAG: GAF domain-containing protein [Anaerolineae bacterium]|nr:GAF domain-containing protein [Anaerolineae bacterium]